MSFIVTAIMLELGRVRFVLVAVLFLSLVFFADAKGKKPKIKRNYLDVGFLCAVGGAFVGGCLTYYLLHEFYFEGEVKWSQLVRVGHSTMKQREKGRLHSDSESGTEIIDPKTGKVKEEKDKAIMAADESTARNDNEVGFASEFDVQIITERDDNRQGIDGKHAKDKDGAPKQKK